MTADAKPLGCALCLPNRPGWVRSVTGQHPDVRFIWTACGGCNADGKEPVCTTCDLCVRRRAAVKPGDSP